MSRILARGLGLVNVTLRGQVWRNPHPAAYESPHCRRGSHMGGQSRNHNTRRRIPHNHNSRNRAADNNPCSTLSPGKRYRQNNKDRCTPHTIDRRDRSA